MLNLSQHIHWLVTNIRIRSDILSFKTLLLGFYKYWLFKEEILVSKILAELLQIILHLISKARISLMIWVILQWTWQQYLFLYQNFGLCKNGHLACSCYKQYNCDYIKEIKCSTIICDGYNLYVIGEVVFQRITEILCC